MWTLVGSCCEAGGEAVGGCKGMRRMNWRRRGSCLYVEDLARHSALRSGRSVRGDDAKSTRLSQSLALPVQAVSRLELEPDTARASDTHTSSVSLSQTVTADPGLTETRNYRGCAYTFTVKGDPHLDRHVNLLPIPIWM